MTAQQRKVVGVVVIALVIFFVANQIRKAKRRRAIEMARIAAQSAQRTNRKEEKRFPVVYAKVDIPAREEIKREWLEVKKIPEKYRHVLEGTGYVQDPEEIVGKIALVNIYQGEPVLRERFTAKENIKALSFTITKGYRAVTLKMSTIGAVGGFVRQGDRVDIIGTFNVEYRGVRKKVMVTRTVLPNVKVLAIDQTHKVGSRNDEQENYQNPYKARGKIGYVTVEVTPMQAEELILASVMTAGRDAMKLLLRPEGIAEDKPLMEVVSDVDISGEFEEEADKEEKITVAGAAGGDMAALAKAAKRSGAMEIEVIKGITKSKLIVKSGKEGGGVRVSTGGPGVGPGRPGMGRRIGGGTGDGGPGRFAVERDEELGGPPPLAEEDIGDMPPGQMPSPTGSSGGAPPAVIPGTPRMMRP